MKMADLLNGTRVDNYFTAEAAQSASCPSCAFRPLTYSPDCNPQLWCGRCGALVGNVVHRVTNFKGDHMTEGEQHTHEETVKDEHTNEDGKVTQETTETTQAETNEDE